MLIGELAERTGLSRDTIRYYEKLGLIPVLVRRDNGYKEYPEESAQAVNLIRLGKSLGFTLAEIRAFAGRIQSEDVEFADVRDEIQEKVADIDVRIRNLKAMRKELLHILDTCPARSRLRGKLQ